MKRIYPLVDGEEYDNYYKAWELKTFEPGCLNSFFSKIYKYFCGPSQEKRQLKQDLLSTEGRANL
jgi:hypothetical protein